jgi:hypothetical protein
VIRDERVVKRRVDQATMVCRLSNRIGLGSDSGGDLPGVSARSVEGVLVECGPFRHLLQNRSRLAPGVADVSQELGERVP